AWGKRAGLGLTFWIGLIWVAGALLIHGPLVWRGSFWGGGLSLIWVVGLVVNQSVTGALGAGGGRGPRRRGGLAIRGLVTAVRFLTIVPVPGRALEGADALGRAAAWFPLVGLALGGLLWLLNGALTRL